MLLLPKALTLTRHLIWQKLTRKKNLPKKMNENRMAQFQGAAWQHPFSERRPMFMPKCSTCGYYAENKTHINVRIPKGMMKPHKKYCIYQKMKPLSAHALGTYGYPVWCPLNKCQKTCMECGTRIRDDEGDYCHKHR